MDLTQFLTNNSSSPSSPQAASGVPNLGSFLSADATALGKQGSLSPTDVVSQAKSTNNNQAVGAQQNLLGLFEQTSAQLQEAQVADQIRLNTAQVGMQNALYTKTAMDAFQANTADLQKARDSRFKDYSDAEVAKVNAEQNTPHIWQNPLGYFEGHLQQGYYGQKSDEAIQDVAEIQHAINTNLSNTTSQIQEYTATNNTLSLAQSNLQAASALQGLQGKQLNAGALQAAGNELQGTSEKIFANSLETVSAQDRQKQMGLSQEEMNLQIQKMKQDMLDKKLDLDSSAAQYMAWIASGGKTTQVPSDDQSRSNAVAMINSLPKDQQSEIISRSLVWQQNMKNGAYGTNGANPLQQELMNFSGTASPGTLKTLSTLSNQPEVGQFVDSATMGAQQGILHQLMRDAYFKKYPDINPAVVSDATIDGLNGAKEFGGKEFSDMVKDAQVRATTGNLLTIAPNYKNNLETQMVGKFGGHGTGYAALATNPQTVQALANLNIDPLLLSIVASPDGKQYLTPVNPATANTDISDNLLQALLDKKMPLAKASQAVADFNKKALVVNAQQQGLRDQINGALFLGANFSPNFVAQGPKNKDYNLTDPVSLQKMHLDYLQKKVEGTDETPSSGYGSLGGILGF